MLRFAFAAIALAFAAPAKAEWYKASTRHFVIYSEQNPKLLRSFAEKLEKFDKAARHARNMGDLPPSKGNRLTIFVLPNEREVRRLAKDKTGFVAGFYKGRAAGSVAYVPRRMDDDAGSDISTILLHEYAHHLMMQDLSDPYPEWYVEGFAEFMSTAKFEKDGSVGLGLPANHRYHGLFHGASLPLQSLLAGTYSKATAEQREALYGRGWLLTHYLTFDSARKGQLERYVKGISGGRTPLDAAQSAFGDLKQLERELNAYLGRKMMTYLKVEGPALNVGNIEVTPLSAGASLAVPLLAELKNEPDSATAAALAAKLREVQSRYPGDPLLETTLAEGELAAGQPASALVAADRALAADPQSTDAMILKGRALTEQAAKSKTPTPEQFAQARSWFLKANKIDPEDPEPLFEFFRSFVEAGKSPTPNAIAGLHYAARLAPQDLGLRVTSAAYHLFAGNSKEARVALLPIAYDPHAADMALVARRMIAKIDAGDHKGALQDLERSSSWKSGS